MNIVEIKAYKCPFCGYYSTNKKEVLDHANKCQSNPTYTQECLYCHNLEKDFKQRIMFPQSNQPYCCYFYNGGACPYKNHTDTELMKYIEKEEAKLTKYGIIKNKQGELVWKNLRHGEE